MEIALWIVGINWGLPFVGYTLYALLLWLPFKDYKYMGYKFPAFKLRLAHKDIEPWHWKLWLDWGGHGGFAWIFYRDEPSPWDDEWAEKTVIHELDHSLLQVIFGLVFWLLYFGHMGFIYLFQKDKHPYIDCWIERRARRKAGQKVNYRRDEWPNGPYDRWPWSKNPTPAQVVRDRQQWRQENGITS